LTLEELTQVLESYLDCQLEAHERLILILSYGVRPSSLSPNALVNSKAGSKATNLVNVAVLAADTAACAIADARAKCPCAVPATEDPEANPNSSEDESATLAAADQVSAAVVAVEAGVAAAAAAEAGILVDAAQLLEDCGVPRAVLIEQRRRANARAAAAAAAGGDSSGGLGRVRSAEQRQSEALSADVKTARGLFRRVRHALCELTGGRSDGAREAFSFFLPALDVSTPSQNHLPFQEAVEVRVRARVLTEFWFWIECMVIFSTLFQIDWLACLFAYLLNYFSISTLNCFVSLPSLSLPVYKMDG
jgi:hypothetical protein